MSEKTRTTDNKMIYFFGPALTEGDPKRKDVLGGKGSSLADMSLAGLPVPPGFTVSISCCKHYHHTGKWPEGLEKEIRWNLARLEEVTGMAFGEGSAPLLVSVRSGAAASMPGMLDTILNCGLHPGLEEVMPDKVHFWNVYAQFIRQFGGTVAGIPASSYDEIKAAETDPLARARAIAQAYIRLYESWTSKPFPRTPWDALRECVNAVFESWNNERADIYRKAHDLEHLEGTAVNIQSMFPSWVSGIAFTANPAHPTAEEIVIECAYGLGESVVSGGVTPDRIVLDHGSLRVKEQVLGCKDQVIAALGSEGAAAVDPDAACLSDAQIDELSKIIVNVEKYFGFPVDIEWGLAGGKFALLQSRPIRGLDVARDVEAGRKEEVARLKALVGPKGKVWLIHNLAETLPTPTPLTWDILRKFMSGNGGFGRIYLDLGYRPSQEVREEGFLELICGRIFADADRAADLFWDGMPYRYDHKEVLANPRLLESAPTKFEASKADGQFLLRLPATLHGMFRVWWRTKKARRLAAENFERRVPAFTAYVKEKRAQDLTRMPTPAVIAELRDRMERVLTDFGKASLEPGFFGGCAQAEMEAILVQLMGPMEGVRLARVLLSGIDGDPTLEQNAMLYHVARGKADLRAYIDRYGHRAVAEMELSRPRWREEDSYLRQIIDTQPSDEEHSPEYLHQANVEKRKAATAALPQTLAQWGGSFLREKVQGLVAESHKLLPYRELGKHYLLMGYELLRLACMELGRRWDLGEDVFFLQLEELDLFEKDPTKYRKLAAQREIRWQSAQKLDVPDVIDSAQLDVLGLPREVKAAKEMPATSLSAGVFVGTARIVRTPSEAKDLPADCILVCPSTDPSWTALFTTIKGLIVERGGVLSHGAITARDFSIPAVACPDATLLIADGAKLRVDGDRGHITLIENEE